MKYEDYDNNQFPLAYLITFRCFGTWLHGDERGSFSRQGRNHFGTPPIKPNPILESIQKNSITQDVSLLSEEIRPLIETAIQEVCQFRGFQLFALAVRTNHVHVVVSGNTKPEPMLNTFKAYSTRKLRENGLVKETNKIWSRHGSTRYLWKEKNLLQAIDYVLNGQSGELPPP